MALDVVKSEIQKSAEEAAAASKAEADAEVAKIMASADAEIAAMNEKEEKRLNEAIERLGRQELSSAELESKKIVLAKKKEILAKAFDEALSSLENAPAATRLAQYKQMIKASENVIPAPRVYVSPTETITASDLGVPMLVVDSRITGGIVLESEDGTIQVDMQYRTILQTIWDREMMSLSDILFG